MSIPDTYTTLLSYWCQELPTIRRTQGQNRALWVWRLRRARHWALGRVADELPLEGTKARRIRRLKRGLLQNRTTGNPLYGSWVPRTLERWHRPALSLVLDRTEGGVLNILMVGVAVLGRVGPLAWTLLTHGGSSDFPEPKALLERGRPWLPAAPQQAIVEDGECKSVEWMRYAQDWGGDFDLGPAADTRFPEPEETGQHKRHTLKAWQRGKCRYCPLYTMTSPQYGQITVPL